MLDDLTHLTCEAYSIKMSTLFLNGADFQLDSDNLVCPKARGLLILLFYSTSCPHCGPARQHFNGVASQFMQGNCKFGMMNITQNPRVTQMARASKTPIKYVPYVMAFFNGRPLAICSTACTAQNLIQFVRRCFDSLKGQVDAFGSAKKEDEIPAYAMGRPVCEDGVCYLTYDDAYSSART